MAGRGLQQLPVVTRDQPYRLLGLLDAEDITLAQTLAKVREVLPTALDLTPAQIS